MALRVHERGAVDRPQLFELERAQRRAAGQEALDVIEGASHVDRDALVPQSTVAGQPRLSAGSVLPLRWVHEDGGWYAGFASRVRSSGRTPPAASATGALEVASLMSSLETIENRTASRHGLVGRAGLLKTG